MKPDGYPCDDQRVYTVEDTCQQGYCQGRDLDLCAETLVDCSKQLPNECHAPGICNPRTGICALPLPLSNCTCDDGDPTTVNDTCIDGLCIGYFGSKEETKFLTIGDGECVD